MLELVVILALAIWCVYAFVDAGPGASVGSRIGHVCSGFDRFIQHPVRGGKLPRNPYDPDLWRDEKTSRR